MEPDFMPQAQPGSAGVPSIEDVLAALQEPLPAEAVKTRKVGWGGKTEEVGYVPGEFIIDELNNVFGPLGWSSEIRGINLLKCVRVMKQSRRGEYEQFQAVVACRTRLYVAGGLAFKEGAGTGTGYASQVVDAISNATKSADTDALKRAARLLGNRFGLALYFGEKAAFNEGRVMHARDRRRQRPQGRTQGPPAGRGGPNVPEWAQTGEGGQATYAHTCEALSFTTRHAPAETAARLLGLPRPLVVLFHDNADTGGMAEPTHLSALAEYLEGVGAEATLADVLETAPNEASKGQIIDATLKAYRQWGHGSNRGALASACHKAAMEGSNQ